MNTVHTEEEMRTYGESVVKDNSSLTQDGHPNEGRYGIKLSDKNFIIGDRYLVYAIYPLKNGGIYMKQIHKI